MFSKNLAKYVIFLSHIMNIIQNLIHNLHLYS